MQLSPEGETTVKNFNYSWTGNRTQIFSADILTTAIVVPKQSYKQRLSYGIID